MTMMRWSGVSLGAVLVACAAPSPAAADERGGASFTALPGLTASGTSHVWGVSGDGSTVVGYVRRFSFVTAAAWEGGVVRDLGRIGGDEAAGLGASTNGDVVVGFSDVSGGRPVPARFAGGPPEPLADWQVAWRASAVSGTAR